MAEYEKIIIKQNTQQLLIWLYPADEQERYVSYEIVKYLWPRLSDSGRRSTIHYLAKQRFINIYYINKRKVLALSNFGLNWVENNCSAISTLARHWEGQWSLVALYDNNNVDPGFRALRGLLVQLGAVAVERGLYLIPTFLNEFLVEKLRREYRNCVLIWEVKKWLFGDEKMLIFEKTGLLDLLELYSGLSRDIDELINSKKYEKMAIDSRIKAIMSLYMCWCSLIKDDSGLVFFYFKNSLNAQILLSRLQEQLAHI